MDYLFGFAALLGLWSVEVVLVLISYKRYSQV
ncbi:MAG: hypothetical protein ACI8X5_000022 [Planctomycetota bacterium]|jgi:hypothetical protein